MNPSMLTKLEQLAARHEEVSALLAEPSIIADNDRFRALSMEYSQLEPVANGFLAYRRVQDDLDAAREMASDGDPDLRALAQEEWLDAEQRRAEHRGQRRLGNAPFTQQRGGDVANRRGVKTVQQHDQEAHAEHQPLVGRKRLGVEKALHIERATLGRRRHGNGRNGGAHEVCLRPACSHRHRLGSVDCRQSFPS